MRFAIVILSTWIAAWGVAASAGPPTVVVLKSSPVPQFDEATAAIVDALEKGGAQTTALDLEGEANNGKAILDALRRARPSLVITVGSLATATVLDDPSPLPTVFSMVLYPRQSGFLKDRTRPVSGASLDVPPALAFRYIRRLLPKARTIGVIYSSGETGSVIEEARVAAKAAGLELLAEAVTKPAEVLPALDRLLPRVDAMWSVADSKVFTAQTTPAMILASLRRRVPFFGLSPAQVRAGAVMALSCDYEDVGRQTAEIALRGLGGTNLSSVPVAAPRSVALALNLRTAEHIGLVIPEDVAAEAREVIR
jgi:putative ABC transport system substrate-binding protein